MVQPRSCSPTPPQHQRPTSSTAALRSGAPSSRSSVTPVARVQLGCKVPESVGLMYTICSPVSCRCGRANDALAASRHRLGRCGEVCVGGGGWVSKPAPPWLGQRGQRQASDQQQAWDRTRGRTGPGALTELEPSVFSGRIAQAMTMISGRGT